MNKAREIINIVVTVIAVGVFFMLDNRANVGSAVNRITLLFIYIAVLVIFNSICNLVTNRSKKD